MLLKLELSEIPHFSTTFFSVSGGGVSPLPPWLRPCLRECLTVDPLNWLTIRDRDSLSISNATLSQIMLISRGRGRVGWKIRDLPAGYRSKLTNDNKLLRYIRGNKNWNNLET